MTTTMNTAEKPKTLIAPKIFSDELIDQLHAQVQHKDAASILGESGLAGQLKKQLAERMLAGELHITLTAKQRLARPATTGMAFPQDCSDSQR